MKFEIGFEDFRGFRNQTYIPVRPITLLVGENGSGKSSLLASIKYAHEIIGGKTSASFNDDNFQLGSFGEIAHNSAEKKRRPNKIRLKLRTIVSVLDSQKSPEMPSETEVELILDLTGQDSDTILSAFEFRVQGTSLQGEFGPESAPWKYANADGEIFNIQKTSLPFLEGLQGSKLRFVPSMISDSLHNGRRKTGGSKSKRKLIPDWVGRFFEALVEEFAANVVASWAIRCVPMRTYTPGIGIEHVIIELFHLPFQFAKFARRERAKWKAVRTWIEKFGADSGMFDEVVVKGFGRGSSDPFQILFDVKGVRRNLCDLGHGTSHVLPILYNAAVSEEGTRILIQQPEMHLHPKAQAVLSQHFIEAYKERGLNFVLETHSDFIVDRIRTAIFHNQIEKDDVALLFFEKGQHKNAIHHIELDENGDPISPPENYRNFFMDEQLRVLGLQAS